MKLRCRRDVHRLVHDAACIYPSLTQQHSTTCVCAQRGYDGDWLGHTFSIAVFLGNGLVAILAGLLGHGLVETLSLGPVAPFDAAAGERRVWCHEPDPRCGVNALHTLLADARLAGNHVPCPPTVVLLIGGAVVISSWSENFGDATDRSSLPEQLRKASSAIAADPKIALLGAMQSLFEGSMYTFVFLVSGARSRSSSSSTRTRGCTHPRRLRLVCMSSSCRVSRNCKWVG